MSRTNEDDDGSGQTVRPGRGRFDTISLLSDFGIADEFVGVVKAVIRDIAPQVTPIDLTHNISPFDIRAGSLALARSIAYVPAGVVMAIVDPGVGSDRRAIAVEVADGAGVLIGPDNGLLAPAVAIVGGAQRVIELSNPDYQLAAPGATFAGRDVFAPAAAHICNGVPLDDLGPAVDPASLLPGVIPLPRVEDDHITAEVLWVDRYGNCQLNLEPTDLPATWGDHYQIECGPPAAPTDDQTIRRARQVTTYSELSGGDVGLAIDSYGMLAIVVNQRSAADELGLAQSTQVTIRPTDPPPRRPDAATTPARVTIGRRPDEPNLG